MQLLLKATVVVSCGNNSLMLPKISLMSGHDPKSQGLFDGIIAGRNRFISISLKYTMTWARSGSFVAVFVGALCFSH